MKPDTVTASEIANWAYCPEAWRLDAIGLPSSNQPARAAGIRYHVHKAVAERVAGGTIALGKILILSGLLALAIEWALGR